MLVQAFWALVSAGFIAGTPPDAAFVGIFPSEKACLVAKADLDKQLAKVPEISGFGNTCVLIKPNKGNPT